MRRLASIFIMLLALSVTGWGQTTTYYVDGTAGTDTTDAGMGTTNHGQSTGAAAFETIGYAIYRAAPGDIINVSAGTYAEDLVVYKSLDIRGPNYNVSPNTGTRVAEAIIVPASKGILFEMIQVKADDVSLNGFTFNGDNPLLNSGYTNTTSADIDVAEAVTAYTHGVDRLAVKHNIVQNYFYSGITIFPYPYSPVTPSSGHVVSDNLIRDLGSYDTTVKDTLGSYWGLGVLIYDNAYTQISLNVISNVRTGVQTGNFSAANPDGTFTPGITGNSIAARRMGIFHNLAYSTANEIAVNSNSVTGEFNSNETRWTGIAFTSLSVPASGDGNIISVGSVTTTSVGVEFWNVKNTYPVNLTGGEITGVDYGVFLNNFEGYSSNGNDGAHAALDGVSIDGEQIGVYVLDSPSYTGTADAPVSVEVTDSDVYGTLYGLKLEETRSGKANASITRSDLSGNSLYGVYTNGSNTISAEFNNWGSSNGPCAPANHGDCSGYGVKVTSNVDYTPWNSLYVDDDFTSATPGWGTTHFATIQSAIDAAPSTAGASITVAAGSYAQNLTVDKPVAITSGLASGSENNAPVIQGLVMIAYDGVTIDGMKITNPSGSYGISSAGYNNLTITNNYFTNIGFTKTSGATHAIAISSTGTGASAVDISGFVIRDNVFDYIYGGRDTTLTGSAAKTNNGSGAAIGIGWSNADYDVSGVVIEDNVISHVYGHYTTGLTYDDGAKGAYGIIINVGAKTANPGQALGAIVRGNTISDLEGLWAHAIGMEGDTPNGIVENNIVSDLTDYKTPSDAVAVMVEDNANAGTLTVRNNYFFQNVAVGVFRTASCTGTVNAANNCWNNNEGPCTPTQQAISCTGYGANVSDNVTFEPWIGQATVMPAATIPNTTMDIGDSDITGIELQYNVVPETGGTIYVTTYDTAPAGVTAPAGANVSKYVEITSDMPNGSFGIWITLSVTAGSQAGNFLETLADTADNRLAYFNESTSSWVLVNGFYSSLPASTAGVFDNATGTAEFTFFADHFTVFAFIGGSSASYYNTPATAYPLYVAMTPSTNLNLAANRTVYPNNTWSGGYPGRTDDWGFSGTQPITVYVVPDNSVTFFTSSMTLQWTTGVLGSTVAVSASDATHSGLFTGANRILDSDMLGTTNSIRIDAARSDNTNYDPAVAGEVITTGDFIVKLGLQLLKPGSTGIDVIGADFRRYVDASTSPQYVYVEPFGTSIKAYLGDVANSSDQTSGDGLINTADLNIWSAAYWSGVSGFSGGLTNYKTKFDIGPTTNGTPFTLPVPDTKIEFEDLVIFSISYGLSAANALPKYDENPGSIGLVLGAPVRSGSEIRVPVLLNGTNADVRALKLRLDGVTGRFLGCENGELLAGRGNPVPVFSMQDDSRLAIDLAVLGLEEQPIAGSGELLWLRFDATEMPRISEAEARTSLNRSIRVALNDATAAGFSLAQNYPNPFNPSTTITFTLDRDAEIDLSVYNTFGQKVATILSGSALAGTQQVSWNGTDDAGSALPSGVYIYRLSAGGNTLQRSMMLAK